MKKTLGILLLLVLWPLAASRARLLPPNAEGVSMGQWYTIVRDVDAAKKFWTLMGGTSIKIDGMDVIKFPGLSNRNDTVDRLNGRRTGASLSPSPWTPPVTRMV